MAGKTSIAWTNRTWNPLTGCTRVTAGCDHCYAFAWHDKMYAAYVRNTGIWPNGQTIPEQYAMPFSQVQLLPKRLDEPLHIKEPSMFFVNSMGDFFHHDVPVEYIHQMLDVMRQAHWHTFQILTKRAGRLRHLGPQLDWPSNVWVGVSIENDLVVGRADALRIGAAKAAVRFISAEPLLGPLPSLNLDGVDWLIVGAESGAGARRMQDAWVRDLINRCIMRGIPPFFKQRADSKGHKLEHPLLDGVVWEEFPAINCQARDELEQGA
ncbi:MAG TPA: phage Gp37/Gp68 family protein [Ktedonobacterales bacterium]|nr:phage Gp37/Gp68 family protein [Ktedonobacterales bacterium]